MKQTAVEWYSNKLVEILGDMGNEFTQEQTLANHYALKQAKEMEKGQIIDAYKFGNLSDVYFKPEQYYNETFKNK